MVVGLCLISLERVLISVGQETSQLEQMAAGTYTLNAANFVSQIILGPLTLKSCFGRFPPLIGLWSLALILRLRKTGTKTTHLYFRFRASPRSLVTTGPRLNQTNQPRRSKRLALHVSKRRDCGETIIILVPVLVLWWESHTLIQVPDVPRSENKKNRPAQLILSLLFTP